MVATPEPGQGDPVLTGKGTLCRIYGWRSRAKEGVRRVVGDCSLGEVRVYVGAECSVRWWGGGWRRGRCNVTPACYVCVWVWVGVEVLCGVDVRGLMWSCRCVCLIHRMIVFSVFEQKRRTAAAAEHSLHHKVVRQYKN